MMNARHSSLAIPEFPSLDQQRLALALRAFAELARGQVDDAEECLDKLAALSSKASSFHLTVVPSA